jgi:nucleotide-binding universal stress UspA family protein
MTTQSAVVAAVDGSSESDLAVREAATIAKRLDLPLLILAVVAPPATPLGGPVMAGDWYEDIIRDFESILARGQSTAGAMQVRSCSTLLLRGPVVESIVGYLEENPARLVVVGARGRTALSRYLLGSVSEGLVHHAPCSILVVRPPKPPASPKSRSGPRAK